MLPSLFSTGQNETFLQFTTTTSSLLKILGDERRQCPLVSSTGTVHNWSPYLCKRPARHTWRGTSIITAKTYAAAAAALGQGWKRGRKVHTIKSALYLAVAATLTGGDSPEGLGREAAWRDSQPTAVLTHNAFMFALGSRQLELQPRKDAREAESTRFQTGAAIRGASWKRLDG